MSYGPPTVILQDERLCFKMTNDTAAQTLLNEADLYQSFNRLNSLLGQYLDVYPMIEFSTQNSVDANKYLEGLDALRESFEVLMEALKIHASIRGVDVPDSYED